MGNVKYIGWKIEFHCQQNLRKGLQESARKMEEELEKWKEEVKNARNKFQELNYYTTRQLLVLRSELGKLKAPVPVAYHKAQVMALLQSISLDVTPTDVERVVATERRKTADRKKPDEGATLATVELSSSSSYQQPPASTSEDTLASVDAQTLQDTSVKRAVVKLSVCDLDPKKLEIFKNITEKHRYPEQFVLRAFEDCDTGDWYEIMAWIKKHKVEMAEMLQSMADSDSEEEASEEEEEEEEEEEKRKEEEEEEEEEVEGQEKAQSSILKSQEDEMIAKATPLGICAYTRMYHTHFFIQSTYSAVFQCMIVCLQLHFPFNCQFIPKQKW